MSQMLTNLLRVGALKAATTTTSHNGANYRKKRRWSCCDQFEFSTNVVCCKYFHVYECGTYDAKFLPTKYADVEQCVFYRYYNVRLYSSRPTLRMHRIIINLLHLKLCSIIQFHTRKPRTCQSSVARPFAPFFRM